MWPFGDFNTPYPSRFSEMSLDRRLMVVYEISMFVLFSAAGAVPVDMEFAIAAALVTGISFLSIKHRRAAGWRWPGVSARDILAALAGVAMFGLFLFVATEFILPINRVVLPWYLLALGIGLSNVLVSLRLVRMSQLDFEADCRGDFALRDNVARASIMPPAWLRAAFSVVFLLVWLDAMALLHMDFASVRDSSAFPTITHSEPLLEHGQTRYITPAQNQLINELRTIFSIGCPLSVASAFLLFWRRPKE